ncbi:hypothetical protein [Chryseobacterium proteolyticum]|uniref:hypothetical protein n=1 Tax=Chryseobacterium proteolyticum TaxID=118127 RepID=UPI0039831BF4
MLFPSQLEKERDSITFMGMDVKKKNNRNMFYFRNTLSKKIIDSLDENELIKVKTYLNPAKTWQAQYDSVTIYKLKEK